MLRILSRAAVLALLVLAGIAMAEGRKPGSEFGKREYEQKCASCHGATGDGDGVNKPYLDQSPPDLSLMARQNAGEFPYMHFYAVVDGRFERGESDMPCFADVYRKAAEEDSLDVPYDPERYLETRLVALASHVAALQHR